MNMRNAVFEFKNFRIRAAKVNIGVDGVGFGKESREGFHGCGGCISLGKSAREWRTERGPWMWWMCIFRQECHREWKAERGPMDVVDVYL